MKPIIDNKIENIAPKTAIYSGYLFIFFGIVGLSSNLFAGLGIIAVGILISFSTSGVQIDPEKRLLKDYTKCFGFKFGKWESIEIYTDIAVLSLRQSSTTLSRSNRALTEIEKYYDVCLLNSSHRIKMKVKRSKTQDDAIKEARLLAEKLNLNYTDFNPVISARTRARR
jgi:hypothetical protein